MCLKSPQMPGSDTLIHTSTFAEDFNRCFWDIWFLSRTPPCETICGFLWILFSFFVICLILGLGFTARLHTGGGELCFSSSDTVCPEQCVLQKININLCADFVPSRALRVCVSVCSGAQCVFCFWIRPSSSPIISLCLCMCWFISALLFWPSAGCLLFVSSCVNAEAFDHLWQCEYFSSF